MRRDMHITMDESGGVVLPRAVRKEAGFEPGVPLRVQVRDGRVEIEPAYARVRIVKRGGLRVAELVEPGATITEKDVEKIRKKLRERRKEW